MIDRSTFYARMAICKACEFWKDKCLRGHVFVSATGCPLKKFPPVTGAAYATAKDVPVEPDITGLPGCCGS